MKSPLLLSLVVSCIPLLSATSVAQDKWDFSYQVDDYKPGALLDLRTLNEKVAGESGLVKLSADGNSFVNGRGQPIRWWPVVSDGHGIKDPAVAERHCKWLAKRGVNMVRLHTQVPLAKEGSKITDVNDETIEGIQRFVSIAKKEGIYCTVSPFWKVDKIPESWEIEGASGKSSFGILMIDPKFRAAYKAWVKELYTRPNKYGPPLKDEPAIALVQVQNEDSIFFWTLQAIPPEQSKIFGKAFGDWAKKKFGSLDKALKEWGNAAPGGIAGVKDDLANGILGFYPNFEFNSPDKGPASARKASQVEFMAEFQKDYFKELADYYRSIGVKQLINSTNWRPSDVSHLGDVERYSYGNQVTAVNRYTGGAHTGANPGWRIDPGDIFTTKSDLKDPAHMPFTLKQVLGQPMMITESSWVFPEKYQAEGPFLVSAYSSLTGLGGFYWFAMGSGGPVGETFMNDMRFPFVSLGDQKGLWKWQVNTPQAAGQFPAYALAYRLGYVQQAREPAVYEERSLDSMWKRDMPIIAEEGGFDPNRDKESFASNSPIKSDVDRRAFLVGPVRVKYGGDPAKSKVVDLSKYIDSEKGEIKSLTGEILLNDKTGLCTVKTPKWQGVAGFLKDSGGKFDLGTIIIESDAEYATISAVALDNLPLASSKKILVQLGSVVRPTGWVESPTTLKGAPAFQVNRTGTPPFQVTKVPGKLTVKNSSLKSADILDANFYSVKKLDLKKSGGAAEVELGTDSLYIVLQ